MTYRTEKLPDEPILITQPFEDHDAEVDGGFYAQSIIAALDALKEPVVVILDLTRSNMESQNLAYAASLAIPILNHPNILDRVCVTTSDIMRMTMQGLGSTTFGSHEIHVFDMLDDALAYARSY